MGQETAFLQEIHIAEASMFPEFAQETVCSPRDALCFYFSPSWHISDGLVTERIIDDLRNTNGAVLSVGAGNAYLERFLCAHFKIDAERFVLCDIKRKEFDGFKSYQFDMKTEWPNFDRKFSYVLFPQSGYIDKSKGAERSQKELKHLLASGLETLTSGGQLRASWIFTPEDRAAFVYPVLESQIGKRYRLLEDEPVFSLQKI